MGSAELQLLLATLSGVQHDTVSDDANVTAVTELVSNIEAGSYEAALRAAVRHGVLPSCHSRGDLETAAAAANAPGDAARGMAADNGGDRDGGSGGEGGSDGVAAYMRAAQGCAASVCSGNGASDAAAKTSGLVALLAAAAAALLLFLQANLTGPQPEGVPESPMDLAAPAAGRGSSSNRSSSSGARTTAGSALGRSAASAADRWAVGQLAASGEEALGRVYLPQYLLLALCILLPPLGLQAPGGKASGSGSDPSADAGQQSAQHAAPDLPASWAWWAARALATQQRVLSGRAAALRAPLQQLTKQVVSGFDGGGAAARLADGDPSLQRQLAAAARLEAAAVEQAYGDVKAAGAHLAAAEAALGLSLELTGALGTRTVHQVDAKAQLLVRVAHPAAASPPAHPAQPEAARTAGGAGASDLAAADSGGGGGGGSGRDSVALPQCSDGEDAAALQAALEGASSPDLEGIAADVDVLPAPRIVASEGEVPAALGALEQALLLGRAAQGRAADELAGWQAAPFAEAVLQQPRSWPLPWAAAHLLKARHERGRPRTRDRALLTLQRLADALSATGPPPAAPRLRLAFAVAQPLGVTLRKELGEGLIASGLPFGVALRKELGEGLIASGLVGSALPMFEELELWDSLILCYQMLGKAPQAEALIQARLTETPDEARLWCALGDLRQDDGCYRAAWERSGQRSARAKRSLARSAMRKKDYGGAAEHWEEALALNPLHPDGWFALGYAALKAADDTRAVQAFTRTVQQEPDNGDAWANIAAVHLQHRAWQPAFAAAAEAVKHKRESWQMWSNYALAAAHAGHPLHALRGASQVLELTGGQRLEAEVLGALIAKLADALAADASAAPDAAAADAQQAGAAAGGSSQSAGSAAPASAVDTASAPATQEPAAGVRGEPSGSGAAGAAIDEPMQDADNQQQNAAGLDEAEELGQPDEAAPQQLSEHEAAQLRSGLAKVLKQAAGSAAGDSALWGLLAQFYRATGETTSEREALVRQIRGLQGTPWKQEAAAFESYAAALLQLVALYAAAAEAGEPSARDLSSGRMQLRGVTQQTREKFGGTDTFERLMAALEQVSTLLDAAKATQQ